MKTIKEQLHEIRDLDKMIDCKQLQIERLRAQAESLRSMDFSVDRVQGGPAKDPMKVMDRVIDLSAEITKDIDDLVDLKRKWRKRFQALPAIQRNVVEAYYFDRKTFEEVAVQYGYSWRQVIRIHGYALLNLSKKMS